jgi:hypothetical protein
MAALIRYLRGLHHNPFTFALHLPEGGDQVVVGRSSQKCGE